MKKKLIIMGIGLAVVGTGMIVKKLRNKKNNEHGFPFWKGSL
jgi:hypothetical protein